MAHLVPEQALYRYEATPTQTTVDVVKSLHTNIRAALGSSYETFLQGSYKNDTATGALDVDIVALRKGTISSVFNGTTPTNPIPGRLSSARRSNGLKQFTTTTGKLRGEINASKSRPNSRRMSCRPSLSPI
jgi:hypothetical protein